MFATSRSTGALALTVLCLFLYVWGLGRIPFYTKGEPREALVVWEEIHAGEWILPLRNGVEVPSKPPLFHWLGGLTALVTGDVDEFSVRFPSALLATLSVLLVFWAGAAKWGPTAGLFAGAITATGFEWVRAATTARVDMTLTAFLVASFVALERVLTAERPTPRALLAFYASMGLAALGKGPVGIVLPSLVALAYVAIRRDWARFWRMRPLLGGLLTLAIAGSWYAAAVATGGERFVWKHLWVENVGRFFAADASGAGHVHPWYYLVGGFFTGFAPWSFFVLPLAVHLWHSREELASRGYLYPLVWFAVPFVFYSVSESKRTVYLLPVHPAAALLLGAWWAELAARGARMPAVVDRALQIAGAVLVAAALLAIGVLAAERLGLAPLDLVRPWLHEKDQANLPVVRQIVEARFAIVAVWVAVLVPVVGLLLAGLRRKRWGLVLAALVGFMASSITMVNAVFHPELAWRRTFKPLMAIVRGLVREEDRLYFYRTFDYGAVFYSRRHIPPLGDALPPEPEDGRHAYVLLWESVWQDLGAADRERLQFLHRSEETGPKGRDRLVLALVKRRPPDPAPAGGTAAPGLADPGRNG